MDESLCYEEDRQESCIRSPVVGVRIKITLSHIVKFIKSSSSRLEIHNLNDKSGYNENFISLLFSKKENIGKTVILHPKYKV